MFLEDPVGCTGKGIQPLEVHGEGNQEEFTPMHTDQNLPVLKIQPGTAGVHLGSPLARCTTVVVK